MNSNKTQIDFEFIFKASIIVVLWSTTALVSKLWVGLKGVFPGLFFGFLRYFFGFFALLVILGFQKKIKNLKPLLKNRYRSLLFCSLWLVMMIICQNFSVLFILGATSSVLLNFNPVLIYLFAPLLFIDEKYSKNKTLGFIISTIGIVIVLLASLEVEPNIMTATDFLIGYSLGFLSGVAWAGYSLSLKKYFQDTQSEEVTVINLILASLISLMLSLITEPLPSINSFTLESLWGLIVIGIGASAIAFTLYLQLVQKYGTTRSGNIQFLIPIVSIVFAFIFLNEFSVYTIIGGIFCAIGVGLVNYEKNNNISSRLTDNLIEVKSKKSKHSDNS